MKGQPMDGKRATKKHLDHLSDFDFKIFFIVWFGLIVALNCIIVDLWLLCRVVVYKRYDDVYSEFMGNGDFLILIKSKEFRNIYPRDKH